MVAEGDIIRAQVVYLQTDDSAGDVIVNNYHFRSQTGLDDYQNIADMLRDMYTTSPPGSNVPPLSQMMTGDAVDSSVRVKLYNLSDPKPRAPVVDTDFLLAPLGTAAAAPPQTAICLSWRRAFESGVKRATAYNRVYIGGLSQNALGTGGRPGLEAQQSCANALWILGEAAGSSVSWAWVGYSPSIPEAWPIALGWVDDAFDTQRRRELNPTTKLYVTEPYL